MSSGTRLEIAESLATVDPAEWDRLAGGHPLLSHAFLHALHESGAACADSGWAPQYFLLREHGELRGALPLYLKSHSYGEYVFDWSWADAWQRAGHRYYPKLLSAIPFTPVSCPRLLAVDAAARHVLARSVIEYARETGVSSFHCLFPTEAEAREFEALGCMLRRTVQFHWTNEGFPDFDAFLSRMNHDKRKKLKQERRKVREAGIEFTWKVGGEITPADWRFFVRCYDDTYRRHHSTPYLNLGFFERIAAAMPRHLVLMLGAREGRPVCAAFNVFDQDALYGRYWGTTEYVPGLHFEACYYQAIEFCIARGIARFEGGAQGEHKLARGLMPVTTYSAHWVSDPEFARAVKRFVDHETKHVARYANELEEHAPFKDGPLAL